MPNETPIIFIYIFLVFTGAIAIIAALVKIIMQIIMQSSATPEPSDSSIETIWFKFNAPAGFVYGIIAILLVIYFVKYDHSAEYKKIIHNLKQEVSNIENENADLKMRLSINASDRGKSAFTVEVSSYEPLSLFDAAVMIIYDNNVFSKSTLEFKGVTGVSFSHDGKYDHKKIEFEKGDRIFLKLTSGQIWGINILNEGYRTILEFFKMKNQEES